MRSDEEIEAGAKVLAASYSIETGTLAPIRWKDLARRVLEAAAAARAAEYARAQSGGLGKLALELQTLIAGHTTEQIYAALMHAFACVLLQSTPALQDALAIVPDVASDLESWLKANDAIVRDERARMAPAGRA